jgi:hypothetical protein
VETHCPGAAFCFVCPLRRRRRSQGPREAGVVQGRRDSRRTPGPLGPTSRGRKGARASLEHLAFLQRAGISLDFEHTEGAVGKPYLPDVSRLRGGERAQVFDDPEASCRSRACSTSLGARMARPSSFVGPLRYP